jgi:hypothetical protein
VWCIVAQKNRILVSSILRKTETVAICVILGSADNERSDSDFHRWYDMVGAGIFKEPTVFIFEVEE